MAITIVPQRPWPKMESCVGGPPLSDEKGMLATLGFGLGLQGEPGETLWRLTAPDGVTTSGSAPSRRAARRDAAFTAFALSALARVHDRRRV